jgi:hypothetical protein
VHKWVQYAVGALTVLCLGCLPAPAGPAPTERYWVGGAGRWDDAAHWSFASGGRGGAPPPDAECDAFFDENSGAAVVEIRRQAHARDLVVGRTASPELTLAFRDAVLTCGRDCLLYTGRVDQGSDHSSVLAVGRNLDSADCELPWRGKGNLSIHLTGTGRWRYSLEKDRKPSVFNFAAAAPGQTTTLQPVGVAPGGRDIDVGNQCIFGDATSLLTMDVSEASGARGQPPSVTIEIHHQQDALDVVADGCRVRITSIEHEMWGQGPARLQNRLDLTGLKGKYDVTGAFMAEAGAGPTWTMEGPMDLGDVHLSIEKTVVFDTGGHDLTAGRISLTFGGVPELHVGGAEVVVTGRVNLGGSEQPGRIDLGTGKLTCNRLIVGHSDAAITGREGAVLEALESFENPGGAKLDLDGIVLKGAALTAGRALEQP